VPIHLGETLVGVATVAADSDTSAETFASATVILALAVSSACQTSYAAALWEELQALRQRVRALQRLRSPSDRRAPDPGECTPSADRRGVVGDGSIVERALDFLQRRFTEPDLSLGTVAAALECSPNYLTQCFTRVVGQRMRGYLIALRLDRVCRELRGTELPIKRIALESGFRNAATLSRTFRRELGVSPSEYRCIFARPPGRAPTVAPDGIVGAPCPPIETPRPAIREI
jgi:AraC-like DNA-binding protein